VIEEKPGVAKGFERRLGDEPNAAETIEQLAPHPDRSRFGSAGGS